MKRVGRQVLMLVVAMLAGVPILAQNPDNQERLSVRAFYADSALEHVVVIDVDTMGQMASVLTYGTDTCPLDQKEVLDDVYAITRGGDSLDDSGSNKMEPLGIIELEDYCDSSDDHNLVLGLRLVSDVDRPVTSIIEVETDEVVASVGRKALPLSPGDYGGADVTGHPFWFTDDKFALIDRVNRSIETYQVTRLKSKSSRWRVTLIDTVSTPTAIEYFVKRDRSVLDDRQRHTYYALTEGAPDEGVSPSLLKYHFLDDRLHLMGEVPLLTAGIEEKGDHYADIHPDGIVMYIGSTNGRTHVVDIQKMQLLKTFEIGMDVEQMTFIPDRNIAVITGHDETFVSIIDTRTHQKIKDVRVSEESVSEEAKKSHTGFVSADSGFFYAYATVAGLFYKMNLETLEVERTLKTDGIPLRGAYIVGHRSQK